MLAHHRRIHVAQILRLRHVICVAAETGERQRHENCTGYQKWQSADYVDQKSCEQYDFIYNNPRLITEFNIAEYYRYYLILRYLTVKRPIAEQIRSLWSLREDSFRPGSDEK